MAERFPLEELEEIQRQKMDILKRMDALNPFFKAPEDKADAFAKRSNLKLRLQQLLDKEKELIQRILK